MRQWGWYIARPGVLGRAVVAEPVQLACAHMGLLQSAIVVGVLYWQTYEIGVSVWTMRQDLSLKGVFHSSRPPAMLGILGMLNIEVVRGSRLKRRQGHQLHKCRALVVQVGLSVLSVFVVCHMATLCSQLMLESRNHTAQFRFLKSFFLLATFGVLQ